MKTAKSMIITVITTICLFSICFNLFFSSEAKEIDYISKSYYTSIKLGFDDTLESIASHYNKDSNMSDSEYIEIIKSINNISSEKIHPGCYLTVVYYQ